MSNIYTDIRAEWKRVEGDETTPVHLMQPTEKARQLEALLAAEFKEPLQMYQDGLISTTELMDKLAWASCMTTEELEKKHG